jgi:LacI family transcriptional regulator, galactose operon repressor
VPDRVTIAQVAAEAGVSAMTVSNVVHGRAGASEETRRRVMEVVNRLGYVRNPARGRNDRPGMVGVVTLDLTGQYALEIVRGIADELATAEFEVLISASYQDATRERERVTFLAGGLVDGLILVAPLLEKQTLSALRASPCPVIVVDPRRYSVDVPRIVVDNYGGMRAATEHVLEMGHVRIAYLGGDPDFDSAAQRRRGYRDAMRLADLKVDDAMVRQCDFTYASGFRQASDVMAKESPTAIVAAADLIAMGAIDAARAQGLSVPADISVIGFDDLPQAADSFPPLTTVRQPLHDMGQLAVRYLLNQIDGRPPLPDLLTMPTELVVRGTVAPPTAAPHVGEAVAPVVSGR